MLTVSVLFLLSPALTHLTEAPKRNSVPEVLPENASPWFPRLLLRKYSYIRYVIIAYSYIIQVLWGWLSFSNLFFCKASIWTMWHWLICDHQIYGDFETNRGCFLLESCLRMGTTTPPAKGNKAFLSWFADLATHLHREHVSIHYLRLWRNLAHLFLQPPGFFLQTLGRVLPCQCWSFLDRRNRTEATSSSSSVKTHWEAWNWGAILYCETASWLQLIFFWKFSFHDMLESYQLLFTTSSSWLSGFVHFDDSEFPCDDIFGEPGRKKTWDAHP